MKSKFYVFIKAVLGPVVRLVFNLRFHGAENEPSQEEGPYVLVCNHISNTDPIFLCAGLKHQQPNYMAKKELFKVPLLSSLVRALGAFPVDRGGADVSAIKKTISYLKSGKCIGIFPQGHREQGKTPMEANLKTGAAMITVKAQATVLPCCIKTKDNKFRLFKRIDVYYGKPITFEELGYDSEASGEYLRITNLMFDRVCDLYRKAEEQESGK